LTAGIKRRGYLNQISTDQIEPCEPSQHDLCLT
jgi:hypothetical protein